MNNNLNLEKIQSNHLNEIFDELKFFEKQFQQDYNELLELQINSTSSTVISVKIPNSQVKIDNDNQNINYNASNDLL